MFLIFIENVKGLKWIELKLWNYYIGSGMLYNFKKIYSTNIFELLKIRMLMWVTLNRVKNMITESPRVSKSRIILLEWGDL